jgi:hypothetical protein
MVRRKKIFSWVAGGFIFFFALLVGFGLALPYLINLEPLREKILLVLSQQVGGKVQYERLGLSFFPAPLLTVHRVSFSLPNKINGTVRSMQVRPQLLPLLKGNLRIAGIQLESPALSISLPPKKEKRIEKPKPDPWEKVGGTLSLASEVLTSKFPHLHMVIRNGRLNISRTSYPTLFLENMDGRLTGPPGNFEVDVTCRSNLWEKLSIKGTLNPADFKGGGRIDLTNFRAGPFRDLLSSDIPLGIVDSKLNLTVRFRTEGRRALQAEVEGSIPLLAFHQENKDVVIRGKGLKGAFQMQGDRIDLFLRSLNLDYPQLRLSGKLQFGQKTPAYVVEVEGRNVDVVSTREVALALADKLPIVRTIFEIVKGGRVPSITFRSRGKSMAELDDTEAFSLKGSLREGMIFIGGDNFGRKGIDFDLEQVSGEAVISKGILEVKNLRGRWRNRTLRDGTMRAGLEGKDALFHLDVTAETDLSSLPPLLSRVIKERTFLEELKQIHDVHGKAVGKIVLGERIGSLRAKVEIWEMNLMARYDPLPYPLQIDRGQVTFDGERIGLRDLSGKMGRSSFSGLTAELGIGKEKDLEILSGILSLDLGEVYPWLSSLEVVKGALKGVRSLKGVLSLNSVKLKGSILSPKDWRFEAAGGLSGIEVNASFLPGPISVSSGKFRATREKLSLNNFQTRLLDASFNVSGSLPGYLQGIGKGDLDISGWMAPKDIHRLSDLLGLKSGIFVRAPLSISEGHLSWTKGGDTLFKGDIAFKEGPQISLDVLRGTGRLKVSKLLVIDATSQAEMTFELQDRTLGGTFSGELSERTLDRIFEGYQFHDGWVRGDFRAKIDLDHPTRSTVEGEVKADDLTFPWQFRKRLEVDEISLEAEGDHISVALASLEWGGERFVLSGDVNFSKEKIKLNIDLSAQNIDLEELEEVLGKGEKGAEKRPDLSLEGIIRLRSESLRFQQYTWTSFFADISLGDGGVEVKVKKAGLCGIDTPGVIKVNDKNVFLDVRPFFKGQEIEPTVRCLLNQEVRATGNFEFKGRILGQGGPEELVKSLEGDLEFGAKDGRIYYAVGLVRILEFLSITEIYRGKLPNLTREGLPYDRITIKGTLQKGKLAIKEWTLNGPTMEMAAQGEIDLSDQEINLTVLVAPLKTVDRIIKLIPLVRDILAGTLLTVPVKVTGDLKDPKVTPLSPSAIGAELLAMMKRTLELPFKVIQPLLPEGKPEEKKDQKGTDVR